MRLTSSVIGSDGSNSVQLNGIAGLLFESFAASFLDTPSFVVGFTTQSRFLRLIDSCDRDASSTTHARDTY